MSKIKSMMADDLTAWVEFPGIEEFRVNFRFLKRDELIKIRNKSMKFTFNKKTRQKEEEVDPIKFTRNYVEKVVIGWKGLKIKHLPELLPIDISGMNQNEEITFDIEEAIDLSLNSSIFDTFITETLNDYEIFSRKEEEVEVKN